MSVYLKNISGEVRDFKNIDEKSLRNLLDSSELTRIKGLKDMTPYTASNAKAKKKKAKGSQHTKIPQQGKIE